LSPRREHQEPGNSVFLAQSTNTSPALTSWLPDFAAPLAYVCRGRTGKSAIVEPVFGQIKAVRGLNRFALRGLEKVKAEWKLICLTHNLLKFFRHGWVPQGQAA
jgi:hypothetical protein